MIEDIKNALEGEGGDKFREELANVVFTKTEGQPSVIDTEKGKEFIQTAQLTYWNDNIGTEHKKIHDRYDEDFDKFGIQKKGKTFETLHSVLEEYNELKKGTGDRVSKEEFEALKAEKAKLEESNDGFYKNEFERVQGLLRQNEEEWSAKYNTLKSSIETTENKSWLLQGLSGLQFNVPEDVKNTMIDAILDKELKNVKTIDGKKIFTDGEGKPVRDGLELVTPEGFWKGKLKSILKGDEQRREPANIDKIRDNEDGQSTLDLDTSKFSTRREFNTHVDSVLVEKGIVRNSSEWVKLRSDAYKKYDVKKLPFN